MANSGESARYTGPARSFAPVGLGPRVDGSTCVRASGIATHRSKRRRTRDAHVGPRISARVPKKAPTREPRPKQHAARARRRLQAAARKRAHLACGNGPKSVEPHFGANTVRPTPTGADPRHFDDLDDLDPTLSTTHCYYQSRTHWGMACGMTITSRRPYQSKTHCMTRLQQFTWRRGGRIMAVSST